MGDPMAERIEWDFMYHPPDEDRANRHEAMRASFRGVAMNLIQATPASREQSLALTAIEEAMFWANAAIAREGRP